MTEQSTSPASSETKQSKTPAGLKPRPELKNLDEYYVHTDVEGMCVPLKGALYPDMYNTITEENLFPCFKKNTNAQEFFLKQTVDGKSFYSNLPTAGWRSIMNGKKGNLRPKSIEEVKAMNNRVDAKTSKGLIKICYWPDQYYLERCSKKEEKKRTKKRDTSSDSPESASEDSQAADSSNSEKSKKTKRKSSNTIKQKKLNSALSPENDKSALEKAVDTTSLTMTSFTATPETKIYKKRDLVLYSNENLQDTLQEFIVDNFNLESKTSGAFANEPVLTKTTKSRHDSLSESENESPEMEMDVDVPNKKKLENLQPVVNNHIVEASANEKKDEIKKQEQHPEKKTTETKTTPFNAPEGPKKMDFTPREDLCNTSTEEQKNSPRIETKESPKKQKNQKKEKPEKNSSKKKKSQSKSSKKEKSEKDSSKKKEKQKKAKSDETKKKKKDSKKKSKSSKTEETPKNGKKNDKKEKSKKKEKSESSSDDELEKLFEPLESTEESKKTHNAPKETTKTNGAGENKKETKKTDTKDEKNKDEPKIDAKPTKKRKLSVGEEPPAKKAKFEGGLSDLLKKSVNPKQ